METALAAFGLHKFLVLQTAVANAIIVGNTTTKNVGQTVANLVKDGKVITLIYFCYANNKFPEPLMLVLRWQRRDTKIYWSRVRIAVN